MGLILGNGQVFDPKTADPKDLPVNDGGATRLQPIFRGDLEKANAISADEERSAEDKAKAVQEQADVQNEVQAIAPGTTASNLEPTPPNNADPEEPMEYSHANDERSLEKADDGKPGESLAETSTEELQETLSKLKGDETQGRRAAITKELDRRAVKKALTPDQPSQSLETKGLDGLGDYLRKAQFCDALDDMEKAKYKSKKRVGNKWVYDYGDKKSGKEKAEKIDSKKATQIIRDTLATGEDTSKRMKLPMDPKQAGAALASMPDGTRMAIFSPDGYGDTNMAKYKGRWVTDDEMTSHTDVMTDAPANSYGHEFSNAQMGAMLVDNIEGGWSQPMVNKPKPESEWEYDGLGADAKPITRDEGMRISRQLKYVKQDGKMRSVPRTTEKSMSGIDAMSDYLRKAEGKAPDFKQWLLDMHSESKGKDKAEKSLDDSDLEKGGPYIGKRGGKWADPEHKIPWDAKRHAAGKKQKQAKPVDEHLAWDLATTAMNTGELHNQMVGIRKNLINKMASGKYDHAQAAKFWNYATDNMAEKYKKDFGVTVSPADRLAAARALSDQFFEEAMEGEYGHLINPTNLKRLDKMGVKTAEDFKNLATGKHGKESGKEDGAPDRKEGEYTGIKIGKHNLAPKEAKDVHDTLKQIESGAGPGGAPAFDKAKKLGLIKKNPNGNMYVTKKGKEALKFDFPKDTKKSMQGGIMSLEEYLQKSGMPSGSPKLNQGHGDGPNGGDLDGTGETSGSMQGKGGPGQGKDGQAITESAKKQKLSEDDAEDEAQMREHKKPIETRKSFLPAQQRELTAHARAAAVSQMRKGQSDVQIGRHVLSADEAASDLVKSEDFYYGAAPSLEKAQRPITGEVLCKSCETSHSSALTACPGCGDSITAHRFVPGGAYVGHGQVVLEKSEAPRLVRPQEEPDLYVPGASEE